MPSRRRLVHVRHLTQAELVTPLGGEAEADQAAAVHGHEVDRLRRDELGGDREVALVLAIGVVADDHEASRADLLDRLFDAGERRCFGGGCGLAHAQIVAMPRLTPG